MIKIRTIIILLLTHNNNYKEINNKLYQTKWTIKFLLLILAFKILITIYKWDKICKIKIC